MNNVRIQPALLRVSEACKIAAVGRSRGYEFVANGTWPSVRIGKSVRVPVEGLQAWLASLDETAEDENKPV